MSTKTADRIEKQILLKAPRTRVWRALTNSEEFGAWFKTRFTESFRTGATLRGQITHPGYEHLVVDFVIEAMEPERRFAYRWHPDPIDTSRDYSKEPMTLVEFTLEDAPGGTLLKLVESGFEGIPIDRRAKALKGNEQGWTGQMTAIEKYLQANP
jgi:uncharacterized protein YndB with AHSA1/START domain